MKRLRTRKNTYVSNKRRRAGASFDIDDTTRHIHVDFGTSSAEMSWAEVSRDLIDPVAVDIKDITVDNNLRQIPTLVAVVPRETDEGRTPDENCAELLFGPDVASKLSRGNIEPKHVFARIKQSIVFIDPDDPYEGLSRTQKQDLASLQEAHEQTLEIAKEFDRIFARFPTDDKEEDVHLNNMEDVIRLFLKYFLQKMKRKLRETTSLSPQAFEQAFNKEWHVGVSVPDGWSPERRNYFYTLLVGTDFAGHPLSVSETAAFPEKCQLTSESKSAAAILLKNRLSNALKQPPARCTQMLQDLEAKTFICVDVGDGTVDISSLRLMITRSDDDNATSGAYKSSRMISIIDSTSCRYGGHTINEALKRRLKQSFTNQLEEIIFKTCGNREISQDTFLSYFDVGIELAKQGFSGARKNQSCKIQWHGPWVLPKQSFRVRGGMIRIRETEIEVPEVWLAQSFDEQIAGIGGNKGILDTHIQNTWSVTESAIEILLSGGGSQAPYFSGKMREAYEPEFAVAGPDNHDHSYVAQGGILTLMDPELCKQQVAIESYGIAFSVPYDENNAIHKRRRKEVVTCIWPSGKSESLPDTVEWLTQLGDRSSESPESHLWAYSIELPDGEDPLHFDDSLDLRCPVYKTRNGRIGTSNGWHIDTPGIEKAGELYLPISKARARQIGVPQARDFGGFIQTDDGRWLLDFDIHITHFWSGMLHKFKFEVPEKSEYVKGGKNFVGWASLLGRTVHGAFVGDHNEERIVENAMDLDL